MPVVQPEVTGEAVGRGRIVELDGLRAFAILPVLVFHLGPTQGPLAGVQPLSKLGWMGVDLFFVLSGFLITSILVGSAGKPNYYRNFIARRALRILPLYYGCVVVFTIMTYYASDGEAWKSFARWGGPGWFLCYVGNIRAAMLNELPVAALGFVPLWSVQVEEQFYLLYPVLVALCSFRTLRRVLAGCVVAALVLRSFTLIQFPVSGEVARFVLMPLRMDALALGGLVALANREGRLRSYKTLCRWCLLGGGVALCCIIVFAGPTQFSAAMQSIGYTLIAAVFASVLVLVLVAEKKRPAILRWAPLVYTGQIAYGLYILHTPAQWIVRTAASQVVQCERGGTLHFLLAMSASYVAAAISWKFFESRILALKERFVE